MELYTEKDVEMLKDKIEDIEKTVEDKKANLVEPTVDQRLAVQKIIMDFIRKNKRKIYGGFAQNQLIAAKNPKDAFYEEGKIADLDFYSPDPISDMIELSNILDDNNFPYVRAEEALHAETYKIFVNLTDECDISYVPTNVFHRIPFVEIDGIHYVHPTFILIDMFRMYSDPLGSASFRWGKTFPRLHTMLKHYPTSPVKGKLPNTFKTPGDLKSQTNKLKNTIFDWIKSKSSLILYGNYAYNVYLNESGIIKDSKLGKNYTMEDIPFYEIISNNYREDGKDILKTLQEKHKDMAKDIKVVEYYPFWQFLGYNATYFYKDQPILKLVHYNYRCTSVKKVPAYDFIDGKVKETNGSVLITSFVATLMMNITTSFRYRVNKEGDKYHFYNVMGSHLVEMRNYYLDKHKKTIFDKTVFQEFITDCFNEKEWIDPMRKSRLERTNKAKMGKLVIFRYDPETRKAPKKKFQFANTSGNEIKNPKNYRIIEVTSEILAQREKQRQLEKRREEEEPEEEVAEDILKIKK